MSDVFTITRGCPVCKGDVLGNDTSLYFCKHCNLLFARHSLNE